MTQAHDLSANDNPILSRQFPIPFADVTADHVEPAIRSVLGHAEEVRARIVSSDALDPVAVLDLLDDVSARVSRIVGTVHHLNSVRQRPDLREAWSRVLPDLAAFEARMESDPEVYGVLQRIALSSDALDPERRRFLDWTLDAMRRAGAGLDADRRSRAEALHGELATLANTFSNNVLDGTNAYALDVVDADRLDGIPASAVDRARAAAQAASVDGWRFTLHQPSMLAVMDHATDRDLRRTMYEASQTRGTGEGRDNRPLIPQILERRLALARLLGYAHWADVQTEPRMAGSAAVAQRFERDLFERIEPHFRREVDALESFAREELGIEHLEAWDVRFAFERMRQRRYDLDDEMLRPWFGMDAIQRGVFDLARTLFGLHVTRASSATVWHEDVEYFEVRRDDGTFVGSFYTDWYPRDDKRAGAWMMPLISGGSTADGVAPHLAAVAGNLTPPEDGRPALLTFAEATTVFHEYGHLFHHLASTVSVKSLAGTNVPWDFVELPSQLLENWLHDDRALDVIARHVDDDTPLPADLRARMHDARTFAAAHRMARQLGFGTVDLALHVDFDPERDGDPVTFAQEVMQPFHVKPEFARDGFLAAFGHVFAGGYAAGYYSYMWSEMLDADVFTVFADAPGGVFDAEVGRRYHDLILSQGNARPPEEMVRDFLGREPDPGALLVRNLGLPAAG